MVAAQGRTVPAATIPWLRCREVWIHAALPDDLLDALIGDALTRRRGTQGVELDVRATDRETGGSHEAGGAAVRVEGRAADLARWLTGRGRAQGLHTTTGAPLPQLPPWL
ncbi:hypothetical protein [Streptomyces sp. NPDC005970]|uniref:hypothetical protein n=1 Tax=Streptomyces sp. NPDC005970 TaxID=3156723 RepID=UPI0033F95E2E